MECVDLIGIRNTDSALLTLAYAVATARVRRSPLLKVIHGSGRVARAIRRECRRYKKEGRVLCLLYGEELHTGSTSDAYLSDKAPMVTEEKADPDACYLYFNYG